MNRLLIAAVVLLGACGVPDPLAGRWTGQAFEQGPAGFRVVAIDSTIVDAPAPSLPYPVCGVLVLEAGGHVGDCASGGTWALTTDETELYLQFTYDVAGATIHVDAPLFRAGRAQIYTRRVP